MKKRTKLSANSKENRTTPFPKSNFNRYLTIDESGTSKLLPLHLKSPPLELTLNEKIGQKGSSSALKRKRSPQEFKLPRLERPQQKQQRQQTIQNPPLINADPKGHNLSSKCTSMKKLPTQPISSQPMHQVLTSILSFHPSSSSIDHQISKLQHLTQQYTCLRRDLVQIQCSMLTMGIKRKIGKVEE